MDASGNVVLNGRGMSVARHWRDLPAHRIPERLDDGELGATGPDSDCCWRLGDGEFAPGPIAERLVLAKKQTSTVRGNIVSSVVVPLSQFQNDLAGTRLGWNVDEE